MKKKRAERNRTITLLPQETERYLRECKTAFPQGGGVDSALDSVFWGDCFALLPLLPDQCADLLVVDPPYNLNKSFGASAFQKMSREEYRDYTERWLSLVTPKLKPAASLYVCCDWRSSLVIGEVLHRHFIVRNRITWQREKGRGAGSNWKNAMEDIWFATCAKDYTFNVEAVKMRRKVLAPYTVKGEPKDWRETEAGRFRDTYPSNFWDDISIPYWSMPENTDHPAQKPEKLMAKLILASSNPGDVVLDPFAGSGAAAVTAKKLGRRYIAIESEGEYCALAQKRLADAEENTAIQGYTDGVFWERNTLAYQRRYLRRQEARGEGPSPADQLRMDETAPGANLTDKECSPV